MNWTPRHWHGLNHTSQPEHSSRELENRFTTLEVNAKHQGDRLNLHERVILGILWVLYIIAQDKFQVLAGILTGHRQ